MRSQVTLRRAKALGLVLGMLLVGSCSNGPMVRDDADPSTPSATASGASAAPPTSRGRTVTAAILYQNVELADLSRLGDVDVIVAGMQNIAVPSAAERIHKTGAEAYLYLQSYWYPAGQKYAGLNIGEHLDWTFCQNGNTPLVGRSQGGLDWYFLDANEAEFREWFDRLLEDVKAAGYDGVMFDRGMVALTGAGEKADIWHRVSACTEDPVKKGAPFADAYVGMMSAVHKAGLKLFQNYGHSPFAARGPFRPDPSDPACQKRTPDCRRTDDGKQYVTYFLNEAVAHPKDEMWKEDFEANAKGETDKQFGGKVVGLITQGTLGRDDSRQAVVYQYSRVRLFDVPLAIFTGYDRCRGNLEFCNRLGAYPELTTADWGKPLTAEPTSTACTSGSAINCVWSREYEHGLVVVNASDRPAKATIPLSGKHCGRVVDLAKNATVTSDDCVTSWDVDLPAWTGQPVLIGAPTAN